MKKLFTEDFDPLAFSFFVVLCIIMVVFAYMLFNAQECTAYKFPSGAVTSKYSVSWTNDGVTYVRDIDSFCIETDYKFR